MGRSEIDDIFASKGTPKSSHTSVPSTPSTTPNSLAKKISKKKRKREVKDDAGDAEDHDRPAKRSVPETVVDPSIPLSAPGRQKKFVHTEKRKATTKKPKQTQDKEAEERFKDSRGTGPSTSMFPCPHRCVDAMHPPGRTTEEGFSIYKEDELGISQEGGDTPLCPFDCQCCF
ncbi:hypothetical protein BDY19DRAFT_37973 [Irpex rosettiformis]|uniref:Uncharacterized protein n=1 Tax=Irpex rosettiformis TaxID=378272 RepID=A0ACB8UK39_9APHY|nr:hypothetical protein BDY19DRAFT_37973 [Irpex rosettiformis]